MPYFMVIRRGQDEMIGTVLWDGEAANPEEALVKASEQAIDPELLDMGDMKTESKVNLADTIMEHIEENESRQFSVYEISTDIEDNPARWTRDELDLSLPEVN